MGSNRDVIARMTQFSVQIMQTEYLGSSKLGGMQNEELRVPQGNQEMPLCFHSKSSWLCNCELIY